MKKLNFTRCLFFFMHLKHTHTHWIRLSVRLLSADGMITKQTVILVLYTFSRSQVEFFPIFVRTGMQMDFFSSNTIKWIFPHLNYIGTGNSNFWAVQIKQTGDNSYKLMNKKIDSANALALALVWLHSCHCTESVHCSVCTLLSFHAAHAQLWDSGRYVRVYIYVCVCHIPVHFIIVPEESIKTKTSRYITKLYGFCAGYFAVKGVLLFYCRYNCLSDCCCFLIMWENRQTRQIYLQNGFIFDGDSYMDAGVKSDFAHAD